MKLAFWLIIGVLAVTISVAQANPDSSQTSEYTDVILLTNGATIKGKIIETIPGKEITIERIDGQEFAVPFKRIAVVTDVDNIDKKKAKYFVDNPKKTLIVQWKNITKLGFLAGEDSRIFSISSVNGVQLGKNIFLGAGLGWENYPRGYTLPIYADFHVFTESRYFAPFMFISAGYAIGLSDVRNGGNYGGISYEAGIGTKLLFGDGAAPTIQVGYRVQQAKGLIDGNINESDSYHFISIMAGIAF
ncbi:MAG: hypothetical protein U9N55_04635 [candidate division Zixibacteria bacterium]|nr:hypothetical protein [candidate division Zixibacteria bacterium]